MKNLFPKLIQIIVSCLLVSYLFSRLEWENFLKFKEAVSSPWLFLSPLISLCVLSIAALRWKILVKNFNFSRPYLFFYRNYCLGSFFNVLLPGSLGGDVLRVRSTQKSGLSLRASSFVVITERVSGLISIFVLGSVASFFVKDLKISKLGPQLLYPMYFFALTGLLLLFFVALLFKKPSWQKKIVKRIPQLKSLISSSQDFRHLSLNKMMLPLFLSSLVQIVDFFVSILMAYILGINVSPFVFLIIAPAVFIATALPISLGGLGIREGAMAHFLSLFGVNFEQSILLAFLLHTNSIFVALLGGLVYSISKKREEKLSASLATLTHYP